jgi:hypothetical protein
MKLIIKLSLFAKVIQTLNTSFIVYRGMNSTVATSLTAWTSTFSF